MKYISNLYLKLDNCTQTSIKRNVRVQISVVIPKASSRFRYIIIQGDKQESTSKLGDSFMIKLHPTHLELLPKIGDDLDSLKLALLSTSLIYIILFQPSRRSVSACDQRQSHLIIYQVHSPGCLIRLLLQLGYPSIADIPDTNL